MAQRRYRQRHRARSGWRAPADRGTRERWQHSARVLEAAGQGSVIVVRVLEENALDRLLLVGLIDKAAFQAGLRLRADYNAAHLESRIAASYNPARGINHGGFREYERSDAEEAAYQRWRLALEALPISHRSLVLDLCCHDRPPAAPARIAALRVGLAQLCAWYGI